MEPVTNGDYALEPVDDLDPAQVNRVRGIYEDGFAPHLRAGFATLTSGREADESALALMRGGEPHGFVMLRPLGDSGWMFLRYFVAGQRGQGLGGAMWDQLMAWLRDHGYLLLVWDVEDPDEPGPGPDEVTIRQRRIRFYERHGGRLLPVRGYGNPHGDDWTPMRLMAVPVAGGEAWPDTPAVVSAVYRHRWRLDPRDPRVTATEVAAGAAPDHDQKGA
jgi:GNAT superfamily N-acetyltransferase